MISEKKCNVNLLEEVQKNRNEYSGLFRLIQVFLDLEFYLTQYNSNQHRLWVGFNQQVLKKMGEIYIDRCIYDLDNLVTYLFKRH